MKQIIYTRTDGRLAICNPNRDTFPIPEALTDEEIVARAFSALPSDAINPQIVDESKIPDDRTFRDAWSAGDGTVDVDMPKAREIARRSTINPSKETEIDAAQTPEELKAFMPEVLRK